MKNKDIRFLVTEEFKNEASKAASQDNKSLSRYISDLILEDLKKRRKGEKCKS